MNNRLVIFFLLFTNYLYSQNEIQINTFLENDQHEPAITVLNKIESIAVVWTSKNQVTSSSKSDIFLQFISSNLEINREEILVNDSIFGNQINPQIASNKSGDFVIVWASQNEINQTYSYDIKAKLFPAEQSFYNNEFLVNSHRLNSQTKPQVAINENGEFIIVWESWFQDGSDRGIYAQMFNENGQKNGNEFLVNSNTYFSQARPLVKYFNNGNFIIVWESWSEAEKGYNIFGKVFDNLANVIKDEFIINDHKENYQWFADIAVSPNNSFDIVWCSWEQDGSDGGIYLKSFNSNFEAISSEILVNSSTSFYQWLPKIKYLNDERKIVTWSSWEIDGSREGVFYKILDNKNRDLTLEQRVNTYTENFQWEPSLAVSNENEIFIAWSSWGKNNKDYDLNFKKIIPNYIFGILNLNTKQHIQGNSTTEFCIHIIDSLKLTEHEYEIRFKESNEKILFMVEDLIISEIKIDNFPMNLGSNVQYLTKEFDGIMVELKPNFELSLNLEKSKFVKNSNTNLSFSISESTIFPTVAPIDIAVIWGSTDTLSNGKYIVPLDTAISPSNIREIEIPFLAINILNKNKIETLVIENSNSTNNKWDPNETIIFLTPPEYKTSEFSTHLQLNSLIESDNIIFPNVGDTNFIFTNKPITKDDVFRFNTKKENILLNLEKENLIETFKLYQNYPNPFNPTTTITYTIPNVVSSQNHRGVSSQSSNNIENTSDGRNINYNVSLKIYDILGREVSILVDQTQKPGAYKIEFDASQFTSGVYFYKLQINKTAKVKKMLLLK